VSPASAKPGKVRFGTEIALYGSRSGNVKGQVAITSEGLGCLIVSAAGELTVEGEVEAAAPLRFAFTPGAQHKYNGVVCLPVKEVPEGSRWRGNVEPLSGSGKLDVKGNTAVLGGGPFKVTGSLTMPTDSGAKVLQITGEPTDPLVLLLTPEGYEYVSGRGSATAPDGKTYRWP
jgi:hypothetical protein